MQTVLLYNIDTSWPAAEQESAELMSRRLGHAIRRQGHSVTFSRVTSPELRPILESFDPERMIIFNWCEELPGMLHSEPVVAEILEEMSFIYTGSSAETLRMSYEKARVKELLKARGIATPDWCVADCTNDVEWNCFPAIVKPAHEHCSYGVGPESVVTSRRELLQRVSYILQEFAQPALVEDFIDGREFHVPVWGNNPPEILSVAEMDFSAFKDIHERLCTYEAKFVPDSGAYRNIKTVVPARLSEEEVTVLERACIGAYKVLGCRDYGRVDVRLRDGVFYVLDVNPNADISPEASLPLAASKLGYSYGAMGARLLGFAAERHKRQNVLESSGQNRAPHQ
ncbi:MAG: D-alanine--D-alanine ligase family protein [Kiritimatiellia bacterium]